WGGRPAGRRGRGVEAATTTMMRRRGRSGTCSPRRRSSRRSATPVARSYNRAATCSRASGARQAWCLGAGALDFVYGLGRAGREDVAAVRRDQHVVLDADADPAQLARHRVDDGRRLRLLLVLNLLGGGRAEAEAPLPLLVLAVFAQVIGDRLALGVEIKPRLDCEHHTGLEHPRRAIDLVVADVVYVHAEPVAGAVHIELAIVMHRERLPEPARQRAERDEPLGQDTPGRRVDGLVAVAGTRGRDTGELRPQSHPINCPPTAPPPAPHPEPPRHLPA